MDLRHSLISDELIEDLAKTMPMANTRDGGFEEDRELPKYDYISFMQQLLQGHT